MSDCVFCNILNGDVPATKVYEDADMIIIKDINPIAPIHYLMVLKEHYGKLEQQSLAQSQKLGQCINKISVFKSRLGLDMGYRLIINQGYNAGQTVEHMHVHILGGKKLNWE